MRTHVKQNGGTFIHTVPFPPYPMPLSAPYVSYYLSNSYIPLKTYLFSPFRDKALPQNLLPM